MRSVTPMRVAKIGYIVISLALCVFGIMLIVNPDISLAAFGVFTGVCLIVFGAVKIIGYLSKDLYRLAFQYDLAFGILMIALGIMVILEPNNVIDTICVAIGIAFLTDGLLKIQIAIDARSFGIKQWWLVLSMAILAVVVGILLVFRTAESVRTLMVLLGSPIKLPLNMKTRFWMIPLPYNDYMMAKSHKAFRRAALRRSKTAGLFCHILIAMSIGRMI